MKISVQENTDHRTFVPKWIQHLEKKSVKWTSVNIHKPSGQKELLNSDAFLWHPIHNLLDKKLIKTYYPTKFGNPGLLLFPAAKEVQTFDNKMAQFEILKEAGLPVVDTVGLWSYEACEEHASKASFPMVIKLTSGAGSTNVRKIKSSQELLDFGKVFFTKGEIPNYHNNFMAKIRSRVKYVLLGEFPYLIGVYGLDRTGFICQPFLENNHFDVRINIIGDKAFGFRRHNRANDFRASGSGDLDYSAEEVPQKCIEIAYEVSQKLGFYNMAYDFLKDTEGHWLIGEMCFGYLPSAVAACPGYWDAQQGWHAGSIEPEELHIDYILKSLSDRS